MCIVFILLAIASYVALVSGRTLRLWVGALCFLSYTLFSFLHLLFCREIACTASRWAKAYGDTLFL